MSDMMKCITKVAPEHGGLAFEERPIPTPGMGQVLIKNKATAICGTDLHIYQWDAWSQGRVKLPCIIGHEFAGEVVEVGPGVKHVKVGDNVTGEGHITCGFCRNCRMGEGHVCESWRGIGYDIDGCFREYVVHPEQNIWINDKDLPWEQGAIQDPLGNAIHTVFAADCVAQKVAVFGVGPIGMLTVAVLRAIGAAEIYAVGRKNEYRLQKAREAGAHHVIKENEVDPVEYIMDHTNGKGVDVVLELSGNPKAVQDGLHSLRMGGDLVLIGTGNKPVSIDLAKDVVFKSRHIHGVTGRKLWHTWYKMKGLYSSGNLNVAPLITHTFPFAEFEQGFQLMESGNCGKVVLTF
ncbi:MAG: L-threonine 3-dehydrogenase [Pseudomonadota bacterium]